MLEKKSKIPVADGRKAGSSNKADGKEAGSINKADGRVAGSKNYQEDGGKAGSYNKADGREAGSNNKADGRNAGSNNEGQVHVAILIFDKCLISTDTITCCRWVMIAGTYIRPWW